MAGGLKGIRPTGGILTMSKLTFLQLATILAACQFMLAGCTDDSEQQKGKPKLEAKAKQEKDDCPEPPPAPPRHPRLDSTRLGIQGTAITPDNKSVLVVYNGQNGTFTHRPQLFDIATRKFIRALCYFGGSCDRDFAFCRTASESLSSIIPKGRLKFATSRPARSFTRSRGKDQSINSRTPMTVVFS